MAKYYYLHFVLRDAPNSSGTLVRDLGWHYLIFPEPKASVTTGSATAPASWFFSRLTDEYERIGAVYLTYPNEPYSLTSASQIQYYVPHLQTIPISSNDFGAYLLIEDPDSGNYLSTSTAMAGNRTGYTMDSAYYGGSSHNISTLIQIGSTRHDDPSDDTYAYFCSFRDGSAQAWLGRARAYPTNQNNVSCEIVSFSGATAINNLKAFLATLTETPPPEDPYAPLDPSGPSGGIEEPSDPGTPIPFSTGPGLSAVATGFVSLYVPSLSEIRALASYLWSGAFDLNTWKRLFADPMDAIIGLSILPFSVPHGSSGAITIGNITTSASAPLATDQYYTISCGTIAVEGYGYYLDYDPYTKFALYLPYIGMVDISADDIIGRNITLQYIIDIYSGACVAELMCGSSVLYSFSGNCATQIPITSSDWSNVIGGALSVAATAATLVASGGAVAPLAVAGMASTAINAQKPVIRRSGSVSGPAGALAQQTPYLIATRPRPAIPANQFKEIGYPSYITDRLGDLSGLTIVDEAWLSGIPATQQEIAEIETLLKEGVIL